MNVLRGIMNRHAEVGSMIMVVPLWIELYFRWRGLSTGLENSVREFCIDDAISRLRFTRPALGGSLGTNRDPKYHRGYERQNTCFPIVRMVRPYSSIRIPPVLPCCRWRYAWSVRVHKQGTISTFPFDHRANDDCLRPDRPASQWRYHRLGQPGPQRRAACRPCHPVTATPRMYRRVLPPDHRYDPHRNVWQSPR